MYRLNLPHHRLQSCNGDCFDDLYNNCKDYIQSSGDESSFDQSTMTIADPFLNPFTRNRQRSDSSYSTDGYSSDGEVSGDQQRRFDPATAELKRMSQQVSDQTESLEKNFQTFSKALDRLDSRLLQLHRQNGHCCNLLSTFEDYLHSFQEETGSAVNCDEWFMQLNVLNAMLDDFDGDAEPNIQHLNDRMERLYDLFDQERDQPLNAAAQTMENLERQSDQQRFLRSQIAVAQLELNGLNHYIEEQVQQQRDLIAEFVGAIESIAQGVQCALASNETSAEFDCFPGQHFLQEFNKTLNQIQII